MAREKMHPWAPWLLSFGFGLVLSFAGQFLRSEIQAIVVIAGIVIMLAGALWGLFYFKKDLGVPVTALLGIVTAGLALFVAGEVWQQANAQPTPDEQKSTSPSSADVILDAYWQPDSLIDRTVFYRFLACSEDDFEIVAKYVFLPNAKTDEPVSDAVGEDPTCRLVQAGNIPADKVAKPMILVLVHQRRGAPKTLKTTAFFFEPADYQINQRVASAEREDTPGNQLDRYRQRELAIGLAQPSNSLKLDLPEMFAGNPSPMGFGVYGKAFLFEPLTRVVAFCADQGGKVSSLSTDLDSAHAGRHTVEMRWDNPSKTIGLTVDGKDIQPVSGNFADAQCIRSIRPPVMSGLK